MDLFTGSVPRRAVPIGRILWRRPRGTSGRAAMWRWRLPRPLLAGGGEGSPGSAPRDRWLPWVVVGEERVCVCVPPARRGDEPERGGSGNGTPGSPPVLTGRRWGPGLPGRLWWPWGNVGTRGGGGLGSGAGGAVSVPTLPEPLQGSGAALGPPAAIPVHQTPF